MTADERDERNVLLDQKLFHTKAAQTAHRGIRPNLILSMVCRSMGDTQRAIQHFLAASDNHAVREHHRGEIHAIRSRLKKLPTS